MSDENSTSDVGFKCDVNLFFEGVSNANAAKGSVRSTISTANSMADIEGIGRVIAELNNCNIDALIGVIETARDSLLSLDSDFANQYFKLLQTYIKGLDPETLGDEYLAQYIASEKEYWTTLIAMLEKNEDSLSPYMKKQLEIARAMAGYYNVTDKMGANDVGIDELKELYDERKNYEIDLLKINGLSGDALDKAIAELNEKYDIAIAGAECNDAYKQALTLDINDENYQDSYENFLEKQADYQIKLVESNKDLTDEEKEQLKTEINRKLEENKKVVGINVLSNELNKLNVTDKNYRDSAISLLEEQANYQKQLVDLNTDLTDEEKAQLKAEINRKLVENKNVVRLNAVSNEFNNLDITAADYEKKSKSLLDLQKYYTKQIYRSDKSLTPEQLAKKLDEVDSQYESIYLAVESAKIQSDLDILNAKIEEYGKDPKGYKNDPKNSGEDPDKYEETRLTLLNDFRGCTEEQLKLAGLTQAEINEQLTLIDAEIYQAQQDNEWNNMNSAEKSYQYVVAFGLSLGSGLVDVGENIVDGLAMAVGPWLFDEEEVAEFVKTDYSEKWYSSWAKGCGLNDHAAYSAAHTVGNMLGSMAGYALISVATGGLGAGTIAAVATTALVGGLAAGGSASERALNSGATFDQAFDAGTGAFALGVASGMLSGALTAGMPSSINMIGGPLSLNNTLNSTIATIGKYAIVGGVIGAVEPAINPIIEYNVYAKNLKDENGNSLYNSLGDYYAESGAFTNMLIGFGSGAVSAVGDYRRAERNIIGASIRRKNKKGNVEVETEASKQGDLLGDGLDTPVTKAPEIEVETEAYKQGDLLGDGLDVADGAIKNQNNEYLDSLTPEQRTKAWNDYFSNAYGDAFEGRFSGHGDAANPTSYVDPTAARINLDLEVKSIGNSYESVNEAIKNYVHTMSAATDFKPLDDSIDLYYTNTTKKVVEYDSWIIAERRLEKEYHNWKYLSKSEKNSLIRPDANKLVDAFNSAPGSSYIEQLNNSGVFKKSEIHIILTDTYELATKAAENGKFALTGVNGSPSSHITIEDYYHDISLKDQGLLNSHTTQAYTDYVKNGYINSNGTNTVSSIYANDNLKYAINIPGEEDADILQISMWDRKPIIEVDMNGKSFGRSGERQFVSPISDSDQLFSSIQNAKSPVDTQEVVGAATGLPTSGNDRLTRISLDTTEQVAIHNGKESASCKEALSGGLPVYEVDGINHKMREATIEAINFGQSNLSKSNLIVDNFDPKTGALISKYKLIVTENGKTILVLLQ